MARCMWIALLVLTLAAAKALATGDLLYVGGRFSQVGSVAAANVAAFDGTTWTALGAGIAGPEATVHALLALTSDLVVGGNFSTAGGQPASHLAVWSGSRWRAPTAGPSGPVHALASAAQCNASASAVFVGGRFNRTGSTLPASHVALWDAASDAWTLLGTGGVGPAADDAVWALLASPFGELYVGGRFTEAGGLATGSLALWDCRAGEWRAPFGAGVDGDVFALVEFARGQVFVAGRFSSAGGISAVNVARWDSHLGWSALGTGIGADVPGDRVLALLLSSSDLLAGGAFSEAGPVPATGLVAWSVPAAAYQAVRGSETTNSTRATVHALGTYDGMVVAGGDAFSIGGTPTTLLAMWTADGVWTAPTGSAPSAVPDPDTVVLALAVLAATSSPDEGGRDALFLLLRILPSVMFALAFFIGRAVPMPFVKYKNERMMVHKVEFAHQDFHLLEGRALHGLAAGALAHATTYIFCYTLLRETAQLSGGASSGVAGWHDPSLTLALVWATLALSYALFNMSVAGIGMLILPFCSPFAHQFPTLLLWVAVLVSVVISDPLSLLALVLLIVSFYRARAEKRRASAAGPARTGCLGKFAGFFSPLVLARGGTYLLCFLVGFVSIVGDLGFQLFVPFYTWIADAIYSSQALMESVQVAVASQVVGEHSLFVTMDLLNDLRFIILATLFLPILASCGHAARALAAAGAPGKTGKEEGTSVDTTEMSALEQGAKDRLARGSIASTTNSVSTTVFDAGNLETAQSSVLGAFLP